MLPATASPLRGWQAILFLLLAVGIAITFLTFEHFLPARYIKLAVAGLGMCVFALVVFAYPKYGLLLGIFYVYAGLTYYLKVHAGYPIIALVAASAGVNILRGERVLYPPAAFNWMAAFFMAFAMQSFLFAWDFGYAINLTLEFARSLLMVFFVVHLIRNPLDLQRYVLLIFVTVFVTVVMGVANFMFGWVEQVSIIGGAAGVVRLASTYSDPNEFAAFLVAALPLGIYALRRFRSAVLRLLLIIMLFIMLAAIISTFSRAAFLSVALVMVVILLRDGRNKAGFSVAAVLVASVLLLVPTHYWQRLGTLGEIASSSIITDWSLRLRMATLQSAWNMFLDHPLTGVGIGNFIVRSADLFVRRVAHNSYLEVAAGVGIFGFMAWIMMIGIAFREFIRAIRARWPEQYEWMPHLAFYTMMSLVSVMVGALFLSIEFEYIIWLPAAAGLVAGGLARRYAVRPKSAEAQDRSAE
jgi:O-antigen ligase